MNSFSLSGELDVSPYFNLIVISLCHGNRMRENRLMCLPWSFDKSNRKCWVLLLLSQNPVSLWHDISIFFLTLWSSAQLVYINWKCLWFLHSIYIHIVNIITHGWSSSMWCCETVMVRFSKKNHHKNYLVRCQKKTTQNPLPHPDHSDVLI